MIYEDVLPHYLSIGVSKQEIMESCPKELEPYDIANKRKMIRFDEMMYSWWGTYGLSAMSVAIEHCLAGKEAKSSYVENPIFSNISENEGLTQEEIDNRELRKMLFAEELWAKQHKKKGLPETIIL